MRFAMSEAMLRLEAIGKVYNPGQPNALTVLDGVDLEVGRGEVAALVAPSGAGKSTLLHIAGLLDTATSGVVRLGGADLTAAKDQERTIFRRDRIGFVYQFHHLLPEFTALENVVMPQRAAGVGVSAAGARAEELLVAVGLSERLQHRPAALSGGEQQRVAICRALANAPDLLLADEPTGNLDPETAEQVFDVLLNLARQTGLSALVATHNLNLAERMDKTVRLEAGKVV